MVSKLFMCKYDSIIFPIDLQQAIFLFSIDRKFQFISFFELVSVLHEILTFAIIVNVSILHSQLKEYLFIFINFFLESYDHTVALVAVILYFKMELILNCFFDGLELRFDGSFILLFGYLNLVIFYLN